MRRLILVFAALGSLAACDPVESDAIAALGGEQPGVRQGPLHRPGQPCLLCHDGAIGDPPQFTVAGTVYTDSTGTTADDDATVTISDSTGDEYMAVTNAAGNFYVTPAEWSPVFPLSNIDVIPSGGIESIMMSEVGRSGSCATCHVSPAGPASPGPVYADLVEAFP